MRLTVHHVTRYDYQEPPRYLIQRLLMEPSDFASQRRLSWSIAAPGIDTALRYRDGFGNWVHVVTAQPGTAVTEIVASGEVETEDAAGVVRGLTESAALPVFLRRTASTQCSPELAGFALRLDGGESPLAKAHGIMAAVHDAIAYEPGTSHAHTTAAEAFAEGRGVCQDHAHVMIAVARKLGIPARYVTGYLVTGIGATSSAAHAWAELFIADLGWVGFDAANLQCPTDHYVRVAAGLDAAAVTPVRGHRRGAASAENLKVEVRVEISQQ